ncbi:1,2-phenylacetyl-CoA epoxidase subunit B [Chromobacterium alkanivorans]|uniref:1,2-phenylacetyl-CoA epoxidase subunit B n=1 Tax=Chromobacterium alkanivorans TaxID=1071719 RepID=UPI001968726C|nr:1,2-phenylacetyl-CoA epoxidase subunit B [Chromobacterium alkanivorans]MBN3002435.1 1,2-phenylacetyl-CoA epoxidase subunit B [Chromobacterium alkanivorans]
MPESPNAWPRFEVFVLGRNALQYKHSSSLHAADARHALLLARDIYFRRQEGVSLWVAPSASLEENGEPPSSAQAAEAQQYEVFLQLKPGLDHLHVASLLAASARQVLEQAERAFGAFPPGAVWALPSAALSCSAPEEREMLFEPMAGKTYRLPTFFQLPEAVNHM